MVKYKSGDYVRLNTISIHNVVKIKWISEANYEFMAYDGRICKVSDIMRLADAFEIDNYNSKEAAGLDKVLSGDIVIPSIKFEPPPEFWMHLEPKVEPFKSRGPFSPVGKDGYITRRDLDFSKATIDLNALLYDEVLPSKISESIFKKRKKFNI